jgi:RNA polymerase sigma factor (sigma-70 family)
MYNHPRALMTTATDIDTEFSAMMRAHAGMVVGVCMRTIGDRAAAEDAAQETFVHAFMHFRRLRAMRPEALTSWLHHAARGKAIDAIRRAQRRRKWSQPLEETTTASISDPLWASLSPVLDAGLDELSVEQRHIVLRSLVEGVDQRIVADELRISQPTLSRRLEDALERLRSHFRRHGVTVASALMLSTALQAYGAENPPARVLDCIDTPRAVSAPQSWWSLPLLKPAGGFLLLAAVGIVAALLLRQDFPRADVDIANAAIAEFMNDLNKDLAERGQTPIPPASGLERPPRYPSIEAILATIPALDRDLQKRWMQRVRREHGNEYVGDPIRSFDRLYYFHLSELDDWIFGKTAAPPEKIVREAHSYDDQTAEMRKMLRCDGLVIGVAGQIGADWTPERRDFNTRLNGPRDDTGFRTGGRHDAHESGVRWLAEYLAVRALIEPDDVEALSDLKRLMDAVSACPISIIDAMSAWGVSRTRDRAHLQLALKSDKYDSEIEAWLQEEPRYQQWIISGQRGELALWTIPVAEDVISHRFPGQSECFRRGYLHASVLAEVADCLRMHSDLSRAVAGDTRPMPLPVPMKYSAYLGFEQEMLDSEGNSIAMARNRHLAIRLAVRVIKSVRTMGTLPDSVDNLLPFLPGPEVSGGGQDGYGLSYQRVSRNRFRVGVDLSGTRPTYAQHAFRDDEWTSVAPSEESIRTTQQFIEIEVPSALLSEPDESAQGDVSGNT